MSSRQHSWQFEGLGRAAMARGRRQNVYSAFCKFIGWRDASGRAAGARHRAWRQATPRQQGILTIGRTLHVNESCGHAGRFTGSKRSDDRSLSHATPPAAGGSCALVKCHRGLAVYALRRHRSHFSQCLHVFQRGAACQGCGVSARRIARTLQSA